MRRRFTLCLLALAGCGEPSAPAPRRPAALEVVSAPASSVAAGGSAGQLVVRVTDSAGAPVRGAPVYFSVTQGAGRVSPTLDTSDAAGVAKATFTASTIPGTNEATAATSGVQPLRFIVTGNAGATQSFTLTPRDMRLVATQDSAAIVVVPRDAFGNPTADDVSWAVRDSSLVTVTGFTSRPATGATVRVTRRPGQTWVIAAAGAAHDSVRVTVHDSSSSPCDFLATPVTLSVGGTISLQDGLACVAAASPGVEYAAVLHFNTTVGGVSSSVEVTARGITTPPAAYPLTIGATDATPPADVSFERDLRAREARAVGPRLDAARAWYRASGAAAPTGLYALAPSARVGDLVRLNVNAFDFCSNPKPRVARVVAITQTAVVLADTSNPAGGFTSDEYRSFGVALDTLVQPVLTAAFGSPTDLDGNQRVGIFFTSAVNELTTSGANGVVLGFYYLRDLLPVHDALGDCEGSNTAEMFYLLVPDPDGTVNGNARSREYVRASAVGTIAHEYQHLINASRRMYITNAPRVDEEVWLNEGLSHIAEELVFYHASGLSARTNIGVAALADGTPARAALDLYQRGNLARYREYLRATNSNGPVAQSDALGVRGASWSFLRYLADRTRATDGDFWQRMVNSQYTGVTNLESALSGSGVDVLSGMRDWSLAVLLDDTPAAASATLRQPSWDFVSTIPLVLPSFGLVPRVMTDGVPVTTSLIGGGNAYLRFGVTQGKQALVSARTPGGNPLSSAMRLTIVRIK